MEKTSDKVRTSFATNVAFNLLSWGVPLALAFIVTPILIMGLGLGGYGYYTFVLAVIGFGFTTGIGKVAAKYVSEERGKGTEGNLAELLSASFSITLFAAVIQALFFAVIAPFLVSDVLLAPEAVHAELIIAIRIASLIGLVMMLSQVFQSAAQGLHRFRAFSIITLGAAVALNAGSIALALAGYQMPALFWWNLAVTAFAAMAFALYVLPLVPEFRPVIPGSEITRKVLRFAFSIFIYQSITSFLFIFERIYVGRNFGAEAMSYYVVPLMLGIYLHALIVSISQVAIPVLNERIGKPIDFEHFYKNTTRLVLAIATLIGIGFFLIGDRFLALWLGAEFAARSYSLLVIDGFAFMLLAYSVVCWITAEAMHRPGLNAFSSTVTCLVAIVSTLVLSSRFGLEGVAAGRLIGAAVVIPLIFYLEFRIFNGILGRFWLSSVWKLAVAAGTTSLAGILIYSTFPVNWLTFIVSAVLISGVFVGTLVLLGYVEFSDLRELKDARTESREENFDPPDLY